MINELKRNQDILNNLFKKAIDKSRTCSYPGCNKTAINSHILQKNGILNSIQSSGHIRISESNFIDPNLFYFKRSGLNKSFTFKGFCSKHDKIVFSAIEDFEIDFEDYNSQLLFTYRTVLNERYRKEVLLDWHKYQKESNILRDVIDIDKIDKIDEQQRIGIEDINFYIRKIESDLFSDTRSFDFQYRYTNPSEICLASHFSYETTREQQKQIEQTGQDFELLTAIYISFFPIEDENVLIMGYLKEHKEKCGSFVNSFFECSEDELFKKLSDLMLCRCETWVCSEKFYFKLIKPREKRINEIFKESVISIDENRTLDFNLFI